MVQRVNITFFPVITKFNQRIYSFRSIAGIEAILSIHQLHSEADESDIVLRRQIANLMFILSPKLIKTIADIATDEEILGEMLISVIYFIDSFGTYECYQFECTFSIYSDRLRHSDKFYVYYLKNKTMKVINQFLNKQKY